jgi:hypothetical protein
MYRDQINKGLGDDPRATMKAWVILRDLLGGMVRLSPGEGGSLWASYSLQPAMLLRNAVVVGRGEGICRVPAIALDTRLK